MNGDLELSKIVPHDFFWIGKKEIELNQRGGVFFDASLQYELLYNYVKSTRGCVLGVYL